jgi:uncharacterized protein
MQSCIYQGRVGHARIGPVDHRFGYLLFMLYLDLEELPELIDKHWALSRSKVAPAAFRREDHFGDPAVPLSDAVRSLVEEETGTRPEGPIRMLTQLRYWGLYFSPLNLFYCFDGAGTGVECVVAEVSNTPWRERHCYVLWSGNCRSGRGLRYRHPKTFHVSPFMGMDAEYLWALNPPGARLRVLIESRCAETPLFRAGMSLKRCALTGYRLNATLLKYPMMAGKIVAAIYFEAIRLWWKKCPFYPHPRKISKRS